MTENTDDRCDLHIHSNFSDSDTAVEDIFKQAKQKKLRCLAITDHDTLEGIPSARNCSQQYDIELIEAFELSAEHKAVEVHVLGYFVNSDNPIFCKELEEIKILRHNRLIEMAEVLVSMGLKVNVKELLARVGDTIPTRLHLALYLLDKGIVSSLYQAFKKYLSPGRPAYRARFKHSVEEAAALIKKYGGVSFLAHPHMIPNQSWIEEFIALGIDGLEVIYPSMSEAKRSLYSNMAKKSNLLKSGGSDAHGSYKEFTKIGQVTIPYDWVEEMKAKLKVLKD